jgi:hypothetical protein
MVHSTDQTQVLRGIELSKLKLQDKQVTGVGERRGSVPAR